MYSPKYVEDWKKHFSKVPDNLKIRVVKTISKILENPYRRHLKHGTQFFVEEFGQNRITYKINEIDKIIEFHFVGDHKAYEDWYKDL